MVNASEYEIAPLGVDDSVPPSTPVSRRFSNSFNLGIPSVGDFNGSDIAYGPISESRSYLFYVGTWDLRPATSALRPCAIDMYSNRGGASFSTSFNPIGKNTTISSTDYILSCELVISCGSDVIRIPYDYKGDSHIYFHASQFATFVEVYVSIEVTASCNILVTKETASTPAFGYANFGLSIPFYCVVYAYDNNSGNSTPLDSINDALHNASGANAGLNSGNTEMSGKLDEYKENTDTSNQYANITDDVISYDKTIFTSLAPTISLFSSVVSSIWEKLGIFAAPLSLMLVVALVSYIIGIVPRKD